MTLRLVLVHFTAGGVSLGARRILERFLPAADGDPRFQLEAVLLPPDHGLELPLGLDSRVRSWPQGLSLSATRRWLDREVERLDPQLVFFSSPVGFRCGARPFVVTATNMEALAMPVGNNPPMEALRNLARRWAMMRASRQADGVVAVSDFVREHLVTRAGIAPGKVAVALLGAEAPVPPSRWSQPTNPPEVGKFWFTVGSILPYRGLEDALQALAELAARGFPEERLVVVGSPGRSRAYLHRMQRLAVTLGVDQRVDWRQRLSDEELGWLYGHCRAFLMTSRVEACPNTAMEAMAHGCVSISSTSPAMPEVFQDAALYYPTGEPTALADRMEEVMRWDDGARGPMSERGRARAESLSWEDFARRTLESCLTWAQEVA